MAPRGAPSQLALGPGYIYIAELGSTEPSGLYDAWTAAWLGPWYTEKGSQFKYALKTDTVEVAEELDPVSVQTVSRVSTVTFAFAEITASNLARALNAAMGDIKPVAGTTAVYIEPPDLGTEKRRMMGFESEDHTERWIFRQCFQTGDSTIQRGKGAANATIEMEYTLEKPTSGKLFKVIFANSRQGT